MCIRDRSSTLRIDKDNAVEIANEIIASDFSGFYVLFWMAVAFTIGKVTLQFYEDHNGDFTQSIIPVSYTHLDVYKRQTLQLLSERFLDFILMF